MSIVPAGCSYRRVLRLYHTNIPATITTTTTRLRLVTIATIAPVDNSVDCGASTDVDIRKDEAVVTVVIILVVGPTVVAAMLDALLGSFRSRVAGTAVAVALLVVAKGPEVIVVDGDVNYHYTLTLYDYHT